MPRAFHHLADLFHVPTRFLDANYIGVVRQFNHKFGGNVVTGGLREVVNNYRQRRTVGDRAIESKDVRRLHLLFVVMRRAHHGNVVTELGRGVGEPQRFVGRLDPCSGNQNFIGCSRFPRGFQHLAALLIGKKNGLSGRTQHDYPGTGRARITLDVALKFFVVDVAVGIKRRSDGRKNTVQKHNEISVSLPGRSQHRDDFALVAAVYAEISIRGSNVIPGKQFAHPNQT